MPFTSKLKNIGLGELLSAVFYGVVGILFLALLPFTNYAPHLGLTGILGLVAAFGIVTKRFWGIWLVVGYFFVATVFSLVTLYYTVGTNLLVSLGMAVYAVLTWVFTVYIVKNRKKFEA